ncbi:MAG TPA: glycosyltransferase [Bradyrhizobium sp.]|uniref:glycosyltransferase n=1 Tax=Bradyrhizobium sp. TaxID=376 RepID=UPI002D7E29E1|nr:glycosyltransferase [Bradyrhizobium sp.]HET7888061.1 glycosyltransferase [Bradyrhizobium sp.]
MTEQVENKVLFLGAGQQMHCGVGQFTHLLFEAIEKLDPGRCMALTLTRSEGSIAGIWRAVGSAQTVVCNFPIVAWKRVILRPLLALAFARLRGRRVVLLQHEWTSLHWLRRLTYVPALLLANTIVMFSPQVRRQLAADPVVGWTAAKCVLAPLPPNIVAPSQTADSRLRQRLKAARQSGRVVIGHFGSIYPGKQPNTLLNVTAILRDRGHRPLTVYVGSFITALDNVEGDFHARLTKLRLSEDVIVSGYVDSGAEIFGLFDEVDAFCYPLEEGLTARRASILAAVQTGRPVIVTGPADVDEFDHHVRFKSLIEHGAIVLVPRGSSDDIYADAILTSLKPSAAYPPFDFESWWRDAANAIKAHL